MNNEIIIRDLRVKLKETIQSELNMLPELLEQLEPKERINVICKLMPFVFPKVETISSQDGEPIQW